MTTALQTDRVVIAIDPHKASWTAAAVDATLQPVDIVRSASAHKATGG